MYIQVKNYCSQQHASQDITSEPMSKGAYHIKFLLMWQLLLSFLFELLYFPDYLMTSFFFFLLGLFSTDQQNA